MTDWQTIDTAPRAFKAGDEVYHNHREGPGEVVAVARGHAMVVWPGWGGRPDMVGVAELRDKPLPVSKGQWNTLCRLGQELDGQIWSFIASEMPLPEPPK